MKRHRGTDRKDEQQKRNMVLRMKEWLESAQEGNGNGGNSALGKETR